MMTSPPDNPYAGIFPWRLFYGYALGPLVTAPILIDGFFTLPVGRALLCVASLYVPFLSLPLAVHALYVRPLPRLLRGARGPLRRAALHGVAVTASTVGTALLIRPLHDRLAGKSPPLLDWVWTCVALTWAFALPAIMAHGLRLRRDEAERRAQAEVEARLSAQLAALQARVSPHFLFNCINTVASLIADDPALAERTLERLADILRYGLQAGRQRLVPLRRELEIAEAYLQVQTARFGERLRFSLEIEEAALGAAVPPLLLQPLVENAVLHGTARRGGAAVLLRARAEGDALCLSVSDDGPGPGASPHSGTRSSLRELRERLAILYGEAARVDIGPSALGGFEIALRLPREAAP